MEIRTPSEIAMETVLSVQEYTLLAWDAVANVFRKPRYLADTLLQADSIGVGSLPVVVLAGFLRDFPQVGQGIVGIEDHKPTGTLGQGGKDSPTSEKCGMPIAEHKEWCSILRTQREMANTDRTPAASPRT